MSAAAGARPGWVTWTGLGVIAGSAAVLSFASVRDLAEAASYPDGLAWLLPVVVDTTAVVASRIWLGQRGQRAAVRYARSLALSAAGVTITGNVLEHGLTAYRLAAPWWLIAALAAVPPAALVAVAHLVALLARAPEPPSGRSEQSAVPADLHEAEIGETSTETAETGTETAETGRDRAETTRDRAVPDGAASDAVLLADLRTWTVPGGAPGRRAVVGRYAIGTSRAARLLAALADETAETRAEPGETGRRPAETSTETAETTRAQPYHLNGVHHV